MASRSQERPGTSQRFGDAEVSHGSQLFQGIVNGNLYQGRRESRLQSIDAASGATFDAANKQNVSSCLEDTRRGLLYEIETWADSREQKRMYWLRGMAGTGKSTIALTIARAYAKERRLGASFFFSRGGGDLASANKFVATIAIQLAETIPELREHIESAFVSDRQILDKGIYNQWEKLVVNPLERLGKDAFELPIIIVVDALDECDDENDISLLVKCFEVATATCGNPLHIFITSRPESPINHAFDSIPRDSHQDFVLHNIEDSIVDEDLMLFYKDRLGRIDQRFGLGANLYSDHTIQVLVQRSHRLFIYAATICRFIDDGREFAGRRLALLINTNNATLEPQKKLDVMYTTVLTYSWPSSIQLEPQEVAERKNLFGHIMGSIVVLFDVMSIIDLAMFLDTSVVKISQLLRSFHSVLDVPQEESGPIRLLHPSFRDFLQDPSRCQADAFSIRTKDIHNHLLSNCLRLMKEHLKRNICKLDHPGVRTQEVPKAAVDKYLPRAIQYACRFWLHHLQHVVLNESLYSMLEEFFDTSFLYWLESLSLLRQIPEAVTMIQLLEARLSAGKSSTPPSSSWFSRKKQRQEQIDAKQMPPLAETVYDATRFLLKYASIIEQAPLQIYCSALVFSPETSIMRKLFSHHIPTWISRQPTPHKHWNQYSQTLIHSNMNTKSLRIHKPNAVVAIAFSPDKRLIVSGSRNGIIRIWAAATGMEQLKIQGHSGRLSAVAFSPNGRLIASTTKEGVVSIWSADTGKERLSIEWTKNPWYHGEMVGKLTTVAFSPDGTLVAAVNENVARIWNALTGEEQCAIEGNLDWLKVIASKLSLSGQDDIEMWQKDPWSKAGALGLFKAKAVSPDCRLAAMQKTGHIDKIYLQDISRSKRLHKLKTSESHRPKLHVAFSPDGHFVASGSANMVLDLWDTATGRKQCTLSGHLDAVSCVAFSPDGKLTSGSLDGTVRLWETTHIRSATDNQQQRPIKYDKENKRHVAVSLDGRKVAWVWAESSMADVQLWSTAASHKSYTLEADPKFGAVTCITFSQDSRLIAITSANGHAIWDTSTGRLRRKTNIISRGLNQVAFSSDGQLVACCNGSSLEILHIATGKTSNKFMVPCETCSVTLTPNSRVVILQGSRVTSLWNISTGTEIHRFEQWMRIVEPSLDGQWMAGIGSSRLAIFDGTTHQEQYCLRPGHSGNASPKIDDCAFSPDSRLLVYKIKADFEDERETKAFHLYETNTHEIIHKFACYDGSLQAFAFSPDGQRIIWTAPDYSIRLWDIVERSELCICSNVEPPRTMSISSCGTFLITDRGCLQLPSATSQRSSDLFASQSWVEKDGKGLIFIPPDYRSALGFVAGNCVVFSNAPDSVLEIETSSSLMID